MSSKAPVQIQGTAPPALGVDLLHGAGAIAEFLLGNQGERRKIYHLAATGQIPTFRLGDVICARRSALLAAIERQESASISSAKVA